MKLKKILSLTMALAMAFALAIPALAEAPSPQTVETAGGNGTTVSSTASGYSGSINITLNPNTIVLNPYQLKATIGEGNAAQSSYHQIFAPAVSCVNKSTFGLKVNAKVSAAVTGSGVTLVTSAPKDTATDKEVFLYAEFGVSDDANTEPTWETVFNAKTASQMLVGAQAAEDFKTVATLNATGGTDASKSSTWNYLWYKFDGAAAKSPTNQWASTDKVTPALVLSFQPTVDTVYAVTVTNTTSKTAGGTAKLNFDLAPAGETISVTCEADDAFTPESVPTVTATQGSTKLTVTDAGAGVYTFKMPAGDVAVTVKWAAGS